MKFVSNIGADRVLDLVRPWLKQSHKLDMVSESFSLFAFAELLNELALLDQTRILIPSASKELGTINQPHHLNLLGTPSDRASRNRLQAHWLARQLMAWLQGRVEVRNAPGQIPQGTLVLRDHAGQAQQAALGSFGFSTEGLGISPGNPLNLIQASENSAEACMLSHWFDMQWNQLENKLEAKASLLSAVREFATHRDPACVYALMLQHLFATEGLDEERIVKSATGIRNTVVWKKLYKFQRDGVVGAIEKLERFGGCIIADSVGLGKTFEALAIIKYHELRNDRVLVLCPKRLRDNWTLYKANDQRNILASDRFNYDVLNHTDLSRDNGHSGDIDLSHVNWGNYDLVVIDESHNFRNKAANKGRETRYDRLMRKVIREGVKTRVLMLSATPVNNRLADLRNQIAFVTEGDDTALFDHGIASINSTTRRAQAAFNRWLDLPPEEKTPALLVEMLGFDYFALLDHLTIARSRRHIEKYYGTAETGRFPDRLPPINIKADVDRAGEFRPIRDINLEIRRLNLSAYAPLRYVLPHRQEAYDQKYSTQIRGGESFFRQVDREESLIHLLRVNVLKRMESAVSSFALTVQRQLKDVEAILARIDAHQEEIEELDIADIDIDDPAFESLLVGRKVKVLLSDVDLLRWKQDLIEDRNRLATLHAAAEQVTALRDDKLQKLRELIADKCRQPLNPGNRKVIVFTAFADTAAYLYEHLATWARAELGIESALVTGTGHNQTTLPRLRHDLTSILTAFSPRSKGRPQELAHEGELDLLIATDCISEGQNLQDCDWLINFDIHWNPVRIIQRFGRIDRIGSTNKRIQLVNFWPNMELEEYINLEQRVSGRMVLLDISATGEENIIEQQSGNQMNDLEYRRNQLLKLQETVIDMEDLSSGVAITDLTLTDFRIDLAEYLREHPGKLEQLPIGCFAVTTSIDADIAPGILFCLRAEGTAAEKAIDPSYPLAPHYLVHVGEDGTVLLPYTQAKRFLDRLKRLSVGRDFPDASACARFDESTRHGEDMRQAQELLASAVSSIVGKSEERAVANMVFRLDAVDAYEQKLVKQIEVAAASIQDANNKPYVKLLAVQNRKGRITATIEVDRQNAAGAVRREAITVQDGFDLEQETGRALYADIRIGEIRAAKADQFIELKVPGSEVFLRVGEAWNDIDASAVQRAMIARTIKEHLDKEKRLRPLGVKVLSLFFIDAVAKYRQYDEQGNPVKGEYALMFEEEYKRLARHPDYQSLFAEVDLSAAASEVHNGYFSSDKKKIGGKTVEIIKDTSGSTASDDDTYNLIMREKEQLLSFNSPLKFIFSHSALKEGWDNPNVFQICNFSTRETERWRRQTIGRGLRLCVNQKGERLRGFEINTLTVIATESYEQFAEHLQHDIENDTGIQFGVVQDHEFAGIAIAQENGDVVPLGFEASKALWAHLKSQGYIDSRGKVQDALKTALKDNALNLPEQFLAQKDQIAAVLKKLSGKLEIRNADERRPIPVRKSVLLSPDFKALWDRIKHKTTYRVHFDNEKLIEKCIEAVNDMQAVSKTRLQWKKAEMSISKAGVNASLFAVSEPIALYESDIPLPDLLTELQDRTQLTRKTIARILTESHRLNDFKRNPQQFIELSAEAIKRCKRLALVDGIKYQRLGDEHYYAQELFETEELTGYLKNLVENTQKSVYEHVAYDSSVERDFAEALEVNEAVKVYAKLPGWFKVPTPLGTYNPDWAVLIERNGEERLYFVVETKSSLFEEDLRDREGGKIQCGAAHFTALAVGDNPAEYGKFTDVNGLISEACEILDARRK